MTNVEALGRVDLDATINEIRAMFATCWVTTRKLADLTGVSPSTISRLLAGNRNPERRDPDQTQPGRITRSGSRGASSSSPE